MGDRGNIVIRADWPDDLGEHEAVFLYGHWSGHDMPELLRRALAKRERWTDESYLARIIFDEVIGEHQGSGTGFGISTRLTDNEYDLLVLRDQRVYLLREADYRETGFAGLPRDAGLSFEEYIAVEPRTWESLQASEAGV